MNRTDQILGGLYYLSLLFPVVAGFSNIKRQKADTWVLLVLVIASFCAETIALTMISLKIGNHPVYQIFSLAEYLLYSALFYKWIRNRVIKQSVFPAAVFFIIFWLYARITISDPQRFISNVLITESMIIILFGLYVLLFAVSRDKADLHFDHRFWILLGILFNFGGNIFMYAGMKFIMEQALSLWRFHWLNNVIVNALYAISFLSLAWESREKSQERNDAIWETANNKKGIHHG
jgi:hypothetical protein